MSTTTPAGRIQAKTGAARRSPNRQRAIARVAVWMVAVSGAAFLLPHVFS